MMSVTPQASAARVCAGVDWAKDDHAVCVVGAEGEALARFTIAHDAAGLKDMVRRLLKAGADEVGIERPDGPVVGALLGAGLTVLVIPPSQVKNLRGRYGSAGNKDDRFDAYVLADVERTDRRRLRPLERDTDQTTALRGTVRARRDLVGHRVAVANQLRAHPQIVFPAAVCSSPTSTPTSATSDTLQRVHFERLWGGPLNTAEPPTTGTGLLHRGQDRLHVGDLGGL